MTVQNDDFQWTPSWLKEPFDGVKQQALSLPVIRDLFNPIRTAFERLFDAASKAQGLHITVDSHSGFLLDQNRRIERLEALVRELLHDNR